MNRKLKLCILGMALGLVVGGIGLYKSRSRNPSPPPAATTQWVKASELQPGPLLRDELTPEQLRRIAAIRQVLAQVEQSSPEEFNDGFKRDLHPDRELAVWEHIAKTYQTYTERHQLSLAAKKEVFNLLLLRSMTTSLEDILAHYRLKILTPKEAQAVIDSY